MAAQREAASKKLQERGTSTNQPPTVAATNLQHFALAGQHRAAQLRRRMVQQQAVRLLLQLGSQRFQVEAQACRQGRAG